MLRVPVSPLHLLAHGKLDEVVTLELTGDGLSLYHRPLGIRLPVLHDERVVDDPAGGLELDRNVLVVSAVHDSRVGERSSDGGEVRFSDGVVHDLVGIEEVQAIGTRLAVNDHA
jgi:hypothetical protein